TASANIGVASISQDTAYAHIASQSSSSQIKFEDINQIDEDDMKEMDIKWTMALLSMRADKFWKKIGKKISIQGIDVAVFDKSKVLEEDWPTPSIDTSKCNTSDLQSSNFSISEHGESSGSIMSKPMIKAIPRITLMIKDIGTVVSLGT
nr:ribonuclease H-like domain-containing protein [Tanacetum cinerariifolium]